MFGFVCNKLVFHCSRRWINTITRNKFKIPVLIRWNSTSSITTTSKEQSFTVSYLMNSCGFSLKSALQVSKRIQFNSPEKPDSVIALLKKHGFSENQISKLVGNYPRVLLSSPEKTLLPKFDFFYSKGFSKSDLAKRCSSYPYLLQRSLKKVMVPNYDHIIDLVKCTEKANAIIKSRPEVLRRSWKVFLAPKLNVLRDIGVPQHNFGLFIRRWQHPNPSNLDVKLLKDAVIEVKEMGINPLKSQFVLAAVAKLYGKTEWKDRADIFMTRWGWSQEDFSVACRRNPVFMTLSKEKITRVMEFLVNKMNVESSVITKYPNVLGLSMEKRFIPRAAVFEFLMLKGLIDRKETTLIRMFLLTEEAFQCKFVNSYEEAPELLKLYQEKLNCTSIAKASAIGR